MQQWFEDEQLLLQQEMMMECLFCARGECRYNERPQRASSEQMRESRLDSEYDSGSDDGSGGGGDGGTSAAEDDGDDCALYRRGTERC